MKHVHLTSLTRLYTAVLAAVLCGCTGNLKPPTTVSGAISGIENDLVAARLVGVSHPTTWLPEQEAEFRANVAALQCNQHRANPIVAIMTGPVDIQLNGNFSQSGQFSVSSLTTVPVMGLNGEVVRSNGQQLSLPVSFVSLASLPDAELAREASGSTPLLAQADAVRLAEGKRLVAERDALADKVQAAIAGYPGRRCVSSPEGPFVGHGKARAPV